MAQWLRKYKKFLTLSEPIYLDIETSWNHDYSNPICWMVSAQVLFLDQYYLFRKPTELMSFYLQLIEDYNLSPNEKVLTYIHNASFDLSYLLPYIQHFLPDKDQRTGIFDGEHKIKMYRQGCFEFRCTYMLSATSLEKWCLDLNVPDKKKVGLYDYNKIIYQDDPLSEDEQDYDKYDVISMKECFEMQLKKFGDDVTTVPITSTGYIRRLLRKECLNDKYYRQDYFIKNQITDPKHFRLINNSYSGGYTHGNRFQKSKLHIMGKGELTDYTGKHRDFRSHYPTQLIVSNLPWGKPETYYDIEHKIHTGSLGTNITIDEVLQLSPEYSTITELIIFDMHLKDKNISMPFMQVSKMFEQTNIRKVADNGRILDVWKKEDAEQGYFITYLDNYTLKIINEQYNFNYKIKYVMKMKNKPLPDPIKKVINYLFAEKSNKKIQHKIIAEKFGETSDEAFDAAYELMQVKKLLNAIYGCMCTNPLRPDIDLDYESETPLKILRNVTTDQEIIDGLTEFYNGRNNFLAYQAGCFVTAAARFELYEYICAIGYENVYYCDTDSIFYRSNKEIEKRIEKLNKQKHKKAPYIVDDSGKKIYYDVFEEEPDFKAIKYLHSKCYGVVAYNPKHDQDDLVITVAGIPARTLINVNKKGELLYLTREEELAGITKGGKKHNHHIKIKDPYKALDKLEESYIFKVNTGTTCRYTTHKPEVIEVNGHTIETAGGAIIKTLENKIIHDLDCPADEYKIEVK